MICVMKRFLINLWKKFKSNLNFNITNNINVLETIGKPILNLTEMALLMKLPLADHKILLKICEEIYLKKMT